jgi:hypothetical protein
MAGATFAGACGQGRTLLGAAQGAGATLVGAWGQGRTLLGAAQGAGATLVGAWGQGRTLLGPCGEAYEPLWWPRPVAVRARTKSALVIAMSSMERKSVSVDVSIESVSRQSPDGQARPKWSQRPKAITTDPVGGFPFLVTGNRFKPIVGNQRVPNPQRGLITRWPRNGGGHSGPVILAGSSYHPRGGQRWLSVSGRRVMRELGKIEKMTLWRTLGPLTSFKTLGEDSFGYWSTSGRTDADS